MKYIVVRDYNEAPDKPIKLEENEKVEIREYSDLNGDWPNWVYCKSVSYEGWVPKQIIAINGDTGLITEDYDATEFNLEVGEVILTQKSMNGWVWGTKESNLSSFGWAPLNHLKKIEE